MPSKDTGIAIDLCQLDTIKQTFRPATRMRGCSSKDQGRRQTLQ